MRTFAELNLQGHETAGLAEIVWTDAGEVRGVQPIVMEDAALIGYSCDGAQAVSALAFRAARDLQRSFARLH